MGEVVDPELADFAASWASEIDDEAGLIGRRAGHTRDARRREEMSHLMEALHAVARLLRTAAVGDERSPSDLEPALEPVRDERARAVATAWAFRLHNAAEDAQTLALALERAADALDGVARGDDGLAGKLLLDRTAMA